VVVVSVSHLELNFRGVVDWIRLKLRETLEINQWKILDFNPPHHLDVDENVEHADENEAAVRLVRHTYLSVDNYLQYFRSQ